MVVAWGTEDWREVELNTERAAWRPVQVRVSTQACRVACLPCRAGGLAYRSHRRHTRLMKAYFDNNMISKRASVLIKTLEIHACSHCAVGGSCPALLAATYAIASGVNMSDLPPEYSSGADGKPARSYAESEPPPSYGHAGSSQPTRACQPPYYHNVTGMNHEYSNSRPVYESGSGVAAPAPSAPAYPTQEPASSFATAYSAPAAADVHLTTASGSACLTTTAAPPPSSRDVLCVACNRRLCPPHGAPVFACPCGQRMQAPSPAVATSAPSSAPSHVPAFSTLQRPVVAACPACRSHVHAATNPTRCGGCGVVFTIDLADPLRLRAAGTVKKRNFLSFMLMGD